METDPVAEPEQTGEPVPFALALRLWLWIGVLSFGGPSGQIALLHEQLVERRRWVSERRFLSALNYCMLLPGPEAQQLATYMGWLLHGVRGAIAAGGLFVLPGALLLWALAWIHGAHGERPEVLVFLRSLEPAVVALVAVALWRLSRRALPNAFAVGLAVLALLGLRIGVPFPALILGAALAGLCLPALARKHQGAPLSAGAAGNVERDPRALSSAARAPMGWSRGLRTAATLVLLWAAPLLGIALLGGPPVLAQLALFFTQAALVTFGGAYAVLPYVGEAAVTQYGWVSEADLMAGLALAETTPGPLILVTQWLGFLAAFRAPGELSPALAGALGAAVTTWVTFVPCFFFILLGAPFVHRLERIRGLANALGGITAAVVGCIAALGIWFAQRAFWSPAGGWHWLAIGLCLVFLAGVWRWRWSSVHVVLLAGAVGVFRALLA